MKKGIFIFIAVIISFGVKGQGLNFVSKEDLSLIEEYNSTSFGFTGSIPNKYSMEDYVPFIGNQKGNSCVGFASIFYGLGIMNNMKYNITSSIDKIAWAFDPYFIYSIMEDDCDEGTNMYKALELLTKVGAKKMWYPPYQSCSTDWGSILKEVSDYTTPYKIKDFYFFKSLEVDLLKEALYIGLPIMISIESRGSLLSYNSENSGGVNSNGLWNPRSNENDLGGHAMTVIGYDDYKFGGAFKLVNSWGQEYGDGGYLWIKYDEFISNVEQAFVMELSDFEDNQSSSSSLKYHHMSGEDYIFEGQANRYSDKRSGYSIMSGYNDGKNIVDIGNYVNNNEEGFFVVLIQDGPYAEVKTYGAIYSNGEVTDWETLGFTGSEETSKLQSLKKHLKLVDPSMRVQTDGLEDIISGGAAVWKLKKTKTDTLESRKN